MTARLLALGGVALCLGAAGARAEPGPPCEADSCDVDPGPRPWILSDDCRDATDVVGERHCTPFGRWASGVRDPQLVLEGGLRARQLAVPVTGTLPGLARGLATPRARDATVVTAPLRALGVAGAFHGGLELELGDLSGRGLDRGGLLATGGVIGAAVALGPVDLGLETLAGVRRLRGHFDRAAPDDKVAVYTFVLEARASAGVWVSPWLALEGAVGLDRDARWSAALLLGFHTRAFDGRRH